jgi:hypothetical protein
LTVNLTLAEIQAAMADNIRGGEPIPEAWISAPAGVDLGARLRVYTDGYPARIIEALAETFPTTAHILGDATFTALGKRYVAGLRRAPRNLNHVGSNLQRFLCKDVLCESLPFLPDLASLEWAIQQAFHSHLGEPLDGLKYADWAPENWSLARIGFQPAVTLVRSEWPLSELHDAQQVERESIDIDLTRHPGRFLVYRIGFDVEVESVSEAEADAVEMFKRDARLGEVVERLGEQGADAGCISRLFARWSSLGLVISCAA